MNYTILIDKRNINFKVKTKKLLEFNYNFTNNTRISYEFYDFILLISFIRFPGTYLNRQELKLCIIIGTEYSLSQGYISILTKLLFVETLNAPTTDTLLFFSGNLAEIYIKNITNIELDKLIDAPIQLYKLVLKRFCQLYIKHALWKRTKISSSGFLQQTVKGTIQIKQEYLDFFCLYYNRNLITANEQFNELLIIYQKLFIATKSTKRLRIALDQLYHTLWTIANDNIAKINPKELQISLIDLHLPDIYIMLSLTFEHSSSQVLDKDGA